jgi:HK97 gp10 family phage protein
VGRVNIRVEVHGAKEIARSLGPDRLDDALRPGFKKASVIVEGAARAKVHTVTRKLQGSLGHEIIGQGFGIEGHIGPQPGLGQPRGYSVSDTSRWKKPRAGRNKGDPQVYAQFEEEGTRYRGPHPFLEPALTENVGRIEDVIENAIDAALGRMGL